MAKRIEQIFLVAFGILLILITCICLGKPMHNLIPVRMLVYTIIWLGMLCVGRMLLVLLGGWNERTGRKYFAKILLVVCLALWAFMLYVTGCLARSHLYTDYGNVYEAADALAQGLPVTNWDYFSTCTNNRFPMLFLSRLLWMGYVLGMNDGFYFALGFQVLHVVITAGCLYYLAGRENTENAVADSWTALMLMVLLTPVWGNIAFFYTDQLSFGYSIIGYTMLYFATRVGKRKWFRVLFAAAGGLIWGLAFQIKVTTAIPLIAVGIMMFLRGLFRGKIKIAVIFCISFLIVTLGIGARVAALPCEKNVERDSNPVLYWVALGLNGDGSYAANQDFARQCAQAENVGERKKIVQDKIKSDWKNFFSLEHLTAKVRCNFACGDLGASGYMSHPCHEGNLVYETISWEGKYFWKYACFSTAYIFALYLLMALGAFRGVVRENVETTVMCSYVAFFGLILFLMLWEAQNKQLYNHSGWIILAAGYGLQMIGKQTEDNYKKRGISNGRGKENTDKEESCGRVHQDKRSLRA